MTLELPDPSSIEPLLPAELRAIPVFPLPRVVFFPGTALPLHLFEDRYRAMIDDCLNRGPRVMSVVLLKSGWEEDYDGRPPVSAISGVGRIVAEERLDDGRYNIIVAGLARARLTELSTDRPYRIAKAELLEDVGEVATEDRAALWAVASSLITAVRRQHPHFELGAGPGDPAGVLTDVLADRFVTDVELRQTMLETVDVVERVGLVTELLGGLLAQLAGHDDGGMLH